MHKLAQKTQDDNIELKTREIYNTTIPADCQSATWLIIQHCAREQHTLTLIRDLMQILHNADMFAGITGEIQITWRYKSVYGKLLYA
jgi:hypothetical protein